jgi:tripartite motif-containing protein 71
MVYEVNGIIDIEGERPFGHVITLHDVGQAGKIIELGGDGEEKRMALVDHDKCSVAILNVGSFEPRLEQTIGERGEGPGQFKSPRGLAFDRRTGELYVSDAWLCRISVFDLRGRVLRVFGEEGAKEGQFSCPCGLCITSDGNIAVADSLNYRVQIIRADGSFVRAIGTSVGQSHVQFEDSSQSQRELPHSLPPSHQFGLPIDVCAGRDGSVNVLDFYHRRVEIFDGRGVHIKGFGSYGKDPGKFLSPGGMAVGGDGEIFVADRERNDVQVFREDGELMEIIGDKDPGMVAWTGGPFDVAAGSHGEVIVIDGMRKISVLWKQGGFKGPGRLRFSTW